MHNKIYNFLLSLFLKTNNIDLKLNLAKFIGNYASWNYIGKLREPVIEKFFQKIGESIVEPGEIIISVNKERILHVFTQTFPTGGHTRLAQNIVENDCKREHHLVTTNQSTIQENKQLIESILGSGGKYTRIDEQDILSAAKSLRKLALSAEKIFLYINADDIIPSIALQNLPSQIEIFLINHSDHAFSFGFDIAKKIVNIREEAHKITVHLRQHHNSFVLPLLIQKRPIYSDKNDIRQKLKIPNNGILAISLATTHKFKPNKKHDFFQTIHKALAENSNLHVFIIGFTEEDYLNEFKTPKHERLKFLGLISNPQDYMNAAEIIIDPMPLGSYTAMLETSIYGAYPLVCYDAIPLFSIYNYSIFSGFFSIDKNEAEYLNHLNNLCTNPEIRNNKLIALEIEKHHNLKQWKEIYENIISGRLISKTTSEPPPVRFEDFNQTNEVIKEKLLVFLYSNAHLFSKLSITRIFIFLIINRFDIKESLGILKRNILHDVH